MGRPGGSGEASRRKRRAPTVTSVAVALVGLAVGLSIAGAAEACPVCFQAKTDASRVAFIATTAFMTVLPLLLVGVLAWWVRRRFIRSEQAGSGRSTDAPAAPGVHASYSRMGSDSSAELGTGLSASR